MIGSHLREDLTAVTTPKTFSADSNVACQKVRNTAYPVRLQMGMLPLRQMHHTHQLL